MKWSEVIKDPRYLEANVDEKDKAKEAWFNSTVKTDPRYTSEQDSAIRKSIFGEEPKGQSFREARLGTEIVDREIDFHGKPTKLSKAVQQEEALGKIINSPWIKANVPVVAVGKGVLKAYEQTFGRIFGAYRATLAGKSPIEGLVKPDEQPRAIDSVIKSDFSKRMGVDPATNPSAATFVNGLAGWALDLAGIHLIFNVPIKLAKSLQTTYTGAQGKAVDTFKSTLSSELELAGMSKQSAKGQADVLFYEQWVKTGMLKKTPNAINQSNLLLKSNPGKLGEYIKTRVAEAKASASTHGYTPEVLQKIPQLSGKTTFQSLQSGKALTPKVPVSSKFELAKPPKGTRVSKAGRFVEPKKLSPAERLLQIKTSHMAFKARKATDALNEATHKQEPEKTIPPKGISSDEMNTSPHITLKSGIKPEDKKPFEPEERDPKNMFQVTLQTPAGAKITYMSEENLIKMKEAIRTAPITKNLPKNEGIPVIKIHDEQLLNITEMHLGANPGPALREVKKLYEYMDKMADPVRSAPPEVARTIRQRAIAQNVLSHNISQVKSAMQRLVPDPKQQEIITAFIEPGGETAVGDQMTDNMRLVADLIRDGQSRLGTLAKKHGVIKVVLANYMKHMVQDPLLTADEVNAKIKWALSTGKISKFVESKMPRLRGEDGVMIFPTVASLEAAGYKVVTKNAIDLYDFTMRSEGLAVVNAEVSEKLKSIRYIDPRQPKEDLRQLMALKGKSPPRGYRLLRRGVFTQLWASPEAYNAISAVAEPAMGGRTFRKIAGVSKRIKFLFPFMHAWNLWRNSVETRGIPGSFKMIADGAKQLESPERTSQILNMGVNLFRINKMSGGITDEFQKSLGRFDIPAKTSEWLFTGLGDSVAAGMTGVLEKQLAKAGISGQEADEILSEIVNTLSGNLAPESMSAFVRDIGSVSLLARNWTLSNIREGKGALLGSLPKYWSKNQKGFAQRWYQSALLRGFMHLFTAANVINYMVSKHHYGKGRATWENTGRWDFKIAPLIWVDKSTGREFYATGWYGSLGDIMHWFTRPIQTLANKLNIPVKEGAQQLFNIDFFTKEKISRDSDTAIEGIGRRIGHAAENFLTPAGVTLNKTKVPTPFGVKVLRVLGLMSASNLQDSDLLKKMFNYKEKKRYKVKDIDKELYRSLADGDRVGFMKKVREERRYQTQRGAADMIRKFNNPLASYYRGLSHQDRRDFLETLSLEDKTRLGEAIRRRRQ